MTDDTLESITAQLDRLMRRQRLTQKRVAERSGLAPNTISRVLRARDTRISTLIQIASTIGAGVQITLVSSLTATAATVPAPIRRHQD